MKQTTGEPHLVTDVKETIQERSLSWYLTDEENLADLEGGGWEAAGEVPGAWLHRHL